MMIIGCDFHPGFQQIAYVEQETGEYEESRLSHREEAAAFYRSLAGRAVRIGVEATGNDRWFRKLMSDLGGHELLVGDASAIHASAPREQRIWRNLTRMKLQLIRDRVRLHNQIECLLEEMRIKLSVVVTDLFGVSGLRILHALSQDETDPKNLALLRDERLQYSEELLIEALTGSSHPMHRQMLALKLDRLGQINEQIATLNGLIAQAMKPHQEAVIRLAEVPGLGIDSAQQVIAEVGATAATFPSAAEFTSWVGTCPGKRRKRRGEPQQPLCQRQQVHAADTQPGGSRRRPKQGHSLPGSLPAPAT